MLFQHVAIAGLAHIDAPRRLSSDEINARLKPTLDRLGIKTDVLEDVAGIHARRLWDDGMQASDAATLAGVKALADAGIDRATRSACWSTPRSAATTWSRRPPSIVSGNLGLSDTCQNFDVANACLAFLNGMDIASRMIERGEIDYALVVDGETANLAYEKTIDRLLRADVDRRAVPQRTGHADARLRRRRDGARARRTRARARRATRAASPAPRPSGTSCAAATSTAWSPTPACC